jgi:hypothetical protein
MIREQRGETNIGKGNRGQQYGQSKNQTWTKPMNDLQ